MDCKELKPINPKGNQPWLCIEKTDEETDMKSQLVGKDPGAGKNWKQEKKGMTENKMAGWHHQLKGHEFELWEMVKDREAWHAGVHGIAKNRTWLSDWTATKSVGKFGHG